MPAQNTGVTLSLHRVTYAHPAPPPTALAMRADDDGVAFSALVTPGGLLRFTVFPALLASPGDDLVANLPIRVEVHHSQHVLQVFAVPAHSLKRLRREAKPLVVTTNGFDVRTTQVGAAQVGTVQGRTREVGLL